jgi:hypothetical protein
LLRNLRINRIRTECHNSLPGALSGRAVVALARVWRAGAHVRQQENPLDAWWRSPSSRRETMIRPWYRSRLFWLGLPGLLFMLWLWLWLAKADQIFDFGHTAITGPAERTTRIISTGEGSVGLGAYRNNTGGGSSLGFAWRSFPELEAIYFPRPPFRFTRWTAPAGDIEDRAHTLRGGWSFPPTRQSGSERWPAGSGGKPGSAGGRRRRFRDLEQAVGTKKGLELPRRPTAGRRRCHGASVFRH